MIDLPRPMDPGDPREELTSIVEDLSALSARLDRTALALGDGLVAMSADVASQAVHLALVELQDCVIAA